jgi:hypothetical protein
MNFTAQNSRTPICKTWFIPIRFPVRNIFCSFFLLLLFFPFQLSAQHINNKKLSSANNLSSVLACPSISTHPVSQTICIGQPVTFTVNAGGDPLNVYLWRKNSLPIVGAPNSPSFTLPSVASGDVGNYDVIVSQIGCPLVTSSSAVLSVPPTLNPGTHNTTPVTACQNYDPPSLTVLSTNGGLPAYTFQWFQNSNPVGTNSTTYDPDNLIIAGTYNYTVRITDVCGTQATTAAKTIVIVNDPTVTITGPTSVCPNASAILSR